MALGAAAANRLIIACFAFRAATAITVSSISIGGVAATAVRVGVAVYRTTTYAAAIPTKTGTATNSSPPGAMSPSLTAPDTGFAVGAAYSGGGTNHLITTASRSITGTGGTHTITVDCQDGTSSWTAGLDEDVDLVMEASVAGPMAAASAGWKYP